MDDHGTTSATVEAPERPIGQIPEEEMVKGFSDAEDLHEDPDAPPSVEAPSAALAAATSWRAAKSLVALRDQVNAKFPGRKKDSDGTIGDQAHCGNGGTSDHCPLIREGNVGIVTAMDITHDPSSGCDSEKLAEAIRRSKDPRVKYIISNRKIASAAPMNGVGPFEWRPYTRPNPHSKHVHVSVKGIKGDASTPGYDTISPWTII
jgi:hypothetical protein